MSEILGNPGKIKVLINKEEVIVEEGTVIKSLLAERGAKSRSAVWVNGRQLLLAEYDTYQIQDGDNIKILRVVAGG
ncbi:sulfur carrier protein ThiS [Sinanaerobacter chloroacetimidivorans]|jgi:sulfur carrier protein|uniref:Sulfur carrier protein ThiS n=1 Tax=Sinanaerobacter chloroacetimidivorans TaxID=2818044 RepID=A0A8J7W2D6_9FIRM|nr:sulfur carrier protein ThiS [Sinanaerobacter chloroacetimidivorans]MBR0597903.1 sulfur carrier protein ThiS [Sinanaerobacter chloroacetimidivorans]